MNLNNVVLGLVILGLVLWNLRLEWRMAVVVENLLKQLARITEMWNVEKRWDEGYNQRMLSIENEQQVLVNSIKTILNKEK